MYGLNLDLIRRKREEHKLTQKDLSEALGFKHPSSYLRREKGRAYFKANHLPILAQALKCNISELFFDN